MGLRVSGKRALIRIIQPSGLAFDASGVGADGRARANAFSFEIGAQVVDADGYNQSYTEAVPVGQSRVAGSLTVFYNNDDDEANAVLAAMREMQHDPEACTDASAYTLEIMPEGECLGKEKWTIRNVVLVNLEFAIPHDGLMTITVPWQGWNAQRTRITRIQTCLDIGIPTPGVIASYEPEAEVVGGSTLQGVWVQGLDTDGDYAYISSFAYYDTATDRNVIDRVPLTDDGEMLTGALTRDLRYLNTNGWEGLVYNIRVHGDYVYAGGVNGLWILSKATLQLVGRCDYMEFGWADAPYINVLEVSSNGNYVYVGGSGFGVAVIDVTNKAAPAAVWYDTNVDCEMLALQEPYLYSVDDSWDFVVYDVSTPSAPTKVFQDYNLFEGHFNPAATAISGDLAAFAADTNQISLLSLADPDTPVEVARITVTPLNDYVVAVGAQLIGLYLIVFVLDVQSGTYNGVGRLLFYNVSDPENPALITSLTVGDVGNEDEEGWVRSSGSRYLVVSNSLVSTMFVVDSCHEDLV